MVNWDRNYQHMSIALLETALGEMKEAMRQYIEWGDMRWARRAAFHCDVITKAITERKARAAQYQRQEAAE